MVLNAIWCINERVKWIQDNLSSKFSSGEDSNMDVWSKNHQHYGYSPCVHWLYTCYCSALWDTMGALDNVHCGFRHDYKWLSPQILPYLRVQGRFWTVRSDYKMVPVVFAWNQSMIQHWQGNKNMLQNVMVFFSCDAMICLVKCE